MLRLGIATVSVGILLGALVGCVCDKACPVAEKPAVSEPAPAPVTTTDGRMRSYFAYPTGHEETSVLLLERDLPAEIMSGQEFAYDLKVKNINHMPVKGVTLRDDCAAQLVLTRAEPAPTGQKPPFVWALGDLNPGESRTVHVVGKTSGAEPFTSCASATYNSTLCLTAPVLAPALRLTLSAPGEGTPCDTLPVRLLVTNAGTGAARDVRIMYPLPEGWTTVEGKTSAQFALDTLGANESKEFMVNAKTSRVGDFSSAASATAQPALKADAAPMITKIRQAVLTMKAEGPDHVYAGRPVTFKFTVGNTGTGPATAATIESPVPPGVKFVSATDGGALRNGAVVWALEPLAAKASRTVAMTVEPGAIGELDGAATAKANCATPVRDAMSVSVLGIPALLLEVTDLTDPVEVGGQTIYEIVITNQGSATATNVKIAAMLEDTEQFVSALGAGTKVTGNQVVFDPIAKIAPKGKATLRLTVKCVAEGDTRFKVSMTADQLSRPVDESESTHIYR